MITACLVPAYRGNYRNARAFYRPKRWIYVPFESSQGKAVPNRSHHFLFVSLLNALARTFVGASQTPLL